MSLKDRLRAKLGDDATGLLPFVTEGLSYINDRSDLPAAVNGVITLEAGKAYLVFGDIDLRGDRLVAGGILAITGTSSETASITSTGLTVGVPLLTSRYTLPVRSITFKDVDTALYLDDNAGANAPLALDWFGVNFVNIPNVGEIGTVDNFIFQTGSFLGSQGLRFTGNIGTVGIDNSLFRGTGATGNIFEVTSTATITRRFRTSYSSVIAFGSTKGYVISASATVPVEGLILDTINFSGGGTYIDGLTSGDNKSRWSDCRGIKNSSQISNYYMNNNSTATVVSSTNVTYKALGTTTSSSVSQKFTNTNNRATFVGAIQQDFKVTAVMSIQSGNGHQIGCYVAKNGTFLPESEIRATTGSGGRAEAVVVQVITPLVQNDYVEIFVENTTSATNITVTELNVIVEALG